MNDADLDLLKALQARLHPVDHSSSSPESFAPEVPMPIVSSREDVAHLKPRLKPAAVLVPLVHRPEGVHIVLTKRAADLPSHAGQISFPGGKLQDEDASLWAAALRESNEEIGLLADLANPLGAMPSFATGTGFWVTPYLAEITGNPEFQPNLGEVDAIFEMRLRDVFQPGSFRHETRVMLGKERQTYVVHHDEHDIWGATAYILHEMWRMTR